MTKVSVIMPVFNVENYLDRSINSVINQTFIDWELKTRKEYFRRFQIILSLSDLIKKS